MSDDSRDGRRSVKSDAISPRRRLLEEVLEQRHRAIAFLPVDEAEPPGRSRAWPLGLGRWALETTLRPGMALADRRQRALECAAIALAWLEAVDDELRAREASPER